MRHSIRAAAALLGITPARLRVLIDEGRAPRRTEPVSGRMYLTERDVEVLRATPRRNGRPREKR